MQSQNQNYGALPPGQAGLPPGQYTGAPPAGYQGAPPAGHQGAPPAGYQGAPPAGYQSAPPAGYQGAPPAGYQGAPQQQTYQGAPLQPGYPGQPGMGYPPPQQPGVPQAMGPPPDDGGEIVSQYKGPVPDADVEDNPNAAAPMPSAPPLEKMDTITGYQDTGFNSAVAPPPSYEDAMAKEPTNRPEISNAVAITEDDARAALLEYVAQFCCYGKGTATDMKITELKPTSAFHYTLESFCEGRSTEWAYVAYTGQTIDGPQNGPAPGPWDIQANLPELFKDTKLELEVPHTASVKPCHHCGAMGMIPCFRCHGRGAVRCTTCHGRGHKRTHRGGEWHDERCHWCHGRGRRRCVNCHGCGLVQCTLCLGQRNLKCYIKLTITWMNHLKDHIVERTDLPSHLIRTVSGQLAFEEAYPRVWPINHFPDQEVNTASRDLVAQHATAFPAERMHHQRHKVRIVPVTQVFYSWKDKQLDFFVYGFERKVHAPSYPQTCCCGCSIL